MRKGFLEHKKAKNAERLGGKTGKSITWRKVIGRFRGTGEISPVQN